LNCSVVVVDGKKISNVDRQSVYEPSRDCVGETRSNEHDDYVLRRLLKKTGQSTAVFQPIENGYVVCLNMDDMYE